MVIKRSWTTDELRALRMRTGMSGAQFAAALGVTAGCVSRWQSGQRFPKMTLLLRALEELDRKTEGAHDAKRPCHP